MSRAFRLPALGSRWLLGLGATCALAAAGLYLWLASVPAGHGWRYRRYGNPAFQGAPIEDRVVPEPFERQEATQPFSAEWEAWVQVEQTGLYSLALEADDDAELVVDGQPLVSLPGVHGRIFQGAERKLSEGLHSMRVRLADHGGGKYLRIFWQPMDGPHGWFHLPFPRRLAWPSLEAVRPEPPMGDSARADLFALVLGLASLGAALLWRGRARMAGRPVMPAAELLLGMAILAGALGVRAIHLADVDLHWDETAYHKAGLLFVRNLQLGDWAAESFRWNAEHPPIAKWIYGFADLAGGTLGAKLCSGFLQALTCLILFLLGRRFVSGRVGTGAALALALSPYFLAHGRITGLESPSAFFFALSAYALLVATVEGSWRHQLLWGFASMMGIGARATGVWFGPVAALLAAVALVQGKRRFRDYLPAIAGAALALLAVVAAWPWVWSGALLHLRMTYAHWQGFRPEEWVLGALRFPPLWYYAFAFAASTPTLLLLLALPWGAAALRRRGTLDLLLLAWLVLTFGQSLATMRQDGARYVFQAFPAMAFIAAWGADELVRPIRWRWAPELAQAGLGLYLAACVAYIHPYELDYFSEWVGGTAGVAAKRWMEVPWWGEGEREATRYLNELAAPGARVWVKLMPSDDFPGLRPDLVRGDGPGADYLLLNFFQYPSVPPGYAPLREVHAGGALIAGVYQRR